MPIHRRVPKTATRNRIRTWPHKHARATELSANVRQHLFDLGRRIDRQIADAPLPVHRSLRRRGSRITVPPYALASVTTAAGRSPPLPTAGTSCLSLFLPSVSAHRSFRYASDLPLFSEAHVSSNCASVLHLETCALADIWQCGALNRRAQGGRKNRKCRVLQ